MGERLPCRVSWILHVIHIVLRFQNEWYVSFAIILQTQFSFRLRDEKNTVTVLISQEERTSVRSTDERLNRGNLTQQSIKLTVSTTSSLTSLQSTCIPNLIITSILLILLHQWMVFRLSSQIV